MSCHTFSCSVNPLGVPWWEAGGKERLQGLPGLQGGRPPPTHHLLAQAGQLQGHGDCDLGHGDCDLGHGDCDMGHGDCDMGHGDCDMGHGNSCIGHETELTIW